MAATSIPAKSAGQLAYERDVLALPNYYDGTPRPAFEKLSEVARRSWEANPTDRFRGTVILKCGICPADIIVPIAELESFDVQVCDVCAPPAEGNLITGYPRV